MRNIHKVGWKRRKFKKCNSNKLSFVWGYCSTLSRLIFARLIFAWIYICRYKFCHILSGFIFVAAEILIISYEVIFAVARYVMFMSSMIIAGEKQIFEKLPKMY